VPVPVISEGAVPALLCMASRDGGVGRGVGASSRTPPSQPPPRAGEESNAVLRGSIYGVAGPTGLESIPTATGEMKDRPEAMQSRPMGGLFGCYFGSATPAAPASANIATNSDRARLMPT